MTLCSKLRCCVDKFRANALALERRRETVRRIENLKRGDLRQLAPRKKLLKTNGDI